jgi:uncharacterized protein YdcH (DUF465 family)
MDKEIRIYGVTDLILKKIEYLEELNQTSRDFCKLLDNKNDLDRELKESEFNQRTRREYTIMVLKDILEEMENK